ncbi:KH domain-containing protein [Patescibacteria group bacterium]|nr:KH domain-containing protein [Patescibacteria group bacterium]MBU2633205.1 KH domain-containing protein [Patescibacteria group bacterium]
MAGKFKDEEFLEYVVKALVDVPEAVKVERKVDEMGVLLSLKLDQVDMGKIIGRNGNTAKAIRNLLRVVGLKNQARVNLKIEEPAGSSRVSAPRVSTGSVSESVDDVVEDLKL